MNVELYMTDLPSPDMGWVIGPDRLVLIADHRVPFSLIMAALESAWLSIPARLRSSAA